MKKITIIFGLPGSGKTTYIKDNFKSEDLILDDISLLVKEKTLYNFLKETICSNKEKNIVISDPMLCLENNQKKIKHLIEKNFSEYNVDWIFIDTSYDISVKRALHDSKSTSNLLKGRINIEGFDNLKIVNNEEENDYRKRNNSKI